ncbi:hypothetical protein EDC04DRAFT_109360 [Pisolithus marmoratus]|nr:hypothetical protein EDC04DRAFT_109360 [Pisolithus marmoratus]
MEHRRRKENGFLTKNGIALALRLIGHAQNGDKVRKSLLSVRGPLATTEGVLPPSEEKSTGMSIPKTPPSTPGLPSANPPRHGQIPRAVQPDPSGGSVDGLLSGMFHFIRPRALNRNLAFQGEKARDVFIKSRLPTDTLSQIWDLCDTHHRGALDSVDFTIAMHLIQAVMSGKLTFVPTTLPLGLYEQASGGFTAPVSRGSAHLLTPTSSTFPVSPTKRPSVESQFTFQGIHNIPPLLPSRFPGPTIQTPTVPPSPSATGQPFVSWNITPAEKATYDRFFDSLDTLKRGYLEGEVMVPFMLQSKFPEEVLALVWDLADINNDGRLTRDGFAVALCLIQGKLAGKDVPNTLPPTLVPQSMRKTISPFTTATVSQLSELIRDLWDERSPTLNEHNLLHALHQPQLTGPRMDANAMLRSELQHLNCLRGFVQKLPASAATSCLAGHAVEYSVIRPPFVNVATHIVVLP